jgi:hypothetical protein
MDAREYADDVISGVAAHIEAVGPRAPCSDAEHRSFQLLAEELGPYVDETQLEPFTCHPRAFQGFIRLLWPLMLIGPLAFWCCPLVGLLAGVILLLVTLVQGIYYRKLLDPIFPKGRSQNLVGIKHPRGPRKRVLLLGGHVDSAYEWRWARKGTLWLRFAVIGTVVSLVGIIGVNGAFLLLGGDRTIGWVVAGGLLLIAIPVGLCIRIWENYEVVSPGANDNLSGVFTSMAVARLLHDEGIQLENTELRFLQTGSEEAGLRGAFAYIDEHGEALREVDHLYIALDTIRDLEHLAVYTRDRSVTLANDAAASRKLQDVARSCGQEWPSRWVSFGASDAAAFSSQGLRATLIAAMDPTPAAYYHTRDDTADIMNPEAIAKVLEVLVRFLRVYDQDGLDG